MTIYTDASIYFPSDEECKRVAFELDDYSIPEDAELKGWGGNHGLYTRGKEHHNYGKKYTKEHCKKISESKKGQKYPKCSRKNNPNWQGVQEMGAAARRKKVLVNGVIYNSCTEAAKALDIPKSTFTMNWLKKGKAEYCG